ncbi:MULTISPECIES: energy transducer TonB [Acidobacteriaceae]|uniref:energy transducer TonB n=1 Tax=Acidobacteriaceae TaxID=204434 RepID=UPI00131B7A1F|nr:MULTISPECIES: energy transducer TonB [Acidobacteriaceae]MDW5264278.1 energy transducer TonB [Edaphobacter sp.]
MPFFLDTQETVQRFGSAIAEFRSLLDTNHIRHGSADDLFEFTRTLESSNQFRMDLSALVKSVVRKEREGLLLTDMMSIIAASVGGRSVTDTTADLTQPTNTLMEFLLGTGCWKQFGSPSRPISQRAVLPPKPVVRTEEPEPIRISLPASPAKSAAEVPEDKASLLEISNELRQTLSRLESNTQQVKLHLDSIEQRIGKMEPSPIALSANKSAGLEPLQRRGTADAVAPDVVMPVAEEVPAIDPPLPTRGRAIFFGPTHLDEPRTDEDDDFSSPTFEYGTEKRRRIVPVVIFIVLAAIAAAAFFYIHSARGQALLARFQGDRSHLNSSPPPATSAPAVTAPSPALTADGASPAPPSSTSQLATAVGTAAATSTPSTAFDGANSNVSSDTHPISDSPKLRYVPANVMAGYLLSAPRPEYPAQALRDHLEGQVALQATISRSGAIKTLHVIKGPSSLQSAAVAAVRTWRYRPYSVDGQPQDVATTVYVDFTLRPPPVIVH